MDKEIHILFVEETGHRLNEFEKAVATLAKDPSDKDAVKVIQGAGHALYGVCATVGLRAMAAIAEGVERMTMRLFMSQMPADQETVAVLKEALAGLRKHYEAASREAEPPPADDLPERLGQLCRAPVGPPKGPQAA